jgi:hypothetical protein
MTRDEVRLILDKLIDCTFADLEDIRLWQLEEELMTVDRAVNLLYAAIQKGD